MKRIVFFLLFTLSGCVIPNETDFLKANPWKCPNSSVVTFDDTMATSVIPSSTGTQAYSSKYSIQQVGNGEFDLVFENPNVIGTIFGGEPKKSAHISRASASGFLLRSGGHEDVCTK